MRSATDHRLLEKQHELTVDRIPEEDRGSLEAPLDFVDPLIVESHPFRAVLSLEPTGLYRIPETVGGQVSVRADRVQMPTSLLGESPKPESFAENGAGGGRPGIAIASEEEDKRAQEEDGSRE